MMAPRLRSIDDTVARWHGLAKCPEALATVSTDGTHWTICVPFDRVARTTGANAARGGGTHVAGDLVLDRSFYD